LIVILFIRVEIIPHTADDGNPPPVFGLDDFLFIAIVGIAFAAMENQFHGFLCDA
jgi:hypothetical protein